MTKEPGAQEWFGRDEDGRPYLSPWRTAEVVSNDDPTPSERWNETIETTGMLVVVALAVAAAIFWA